ncbi:50S ribosomal protein L3 [Candidatus Woesearchaeota archaeon]|nr:50S ribosomal protein L3 [Candidatus Woesearchaeota archaeon]
MGQAHRPRKGSMQYWPRKRAQRSYARVKAWATAKDAKPMGFAGYKVGMTHLIITDNYSHSPTKGSSIFMPVTVVECPPIKILSARFYKTTPYGTHVVTEIQVQKAEKELARKLCLAKNVKKKLEDIKPEDIDDVVLVVYTQPKFTGIGKKKPEVFEIALGGDKNAKLQFVKDHLDKEITIADVFKEGALVDIHAVTKGKGFQGPVKRFGVKIRSHKSEKTKRGPGSLGAWCGQGGMMYRVAHAGKMGFHERTEYNKWLVKISNTASDINPSGGFLHYGQVKSNYVLIKGSLPGPAKRLLRLNHAIRPTKKVASQPPTIEYTSIASKQG